MVANQGNGAGIFITFEGGEGAGKTTQIERLEHLLSSKGLTVIRTREPGGTPEAESIRSLLVQRGGGEWDAMAEVLLFSAARVMHVKDVIKPAIDAGHVVICDRFSDSTMAYQGYGHGFSRDKINKIDALAIDNFKPDLTFILDLDVEIGLSRSKRRLNSEEGAQNTEDRFERMEIDFHKRLRQGFVEIAANEPARCHVIDATQSADDVFAAICKIVDEKLG